MKKGSNMGKQVCSQCGETLTKLVTVCESCSEQQRSQADSGLSLSVTSSADLTDSRCSISSNSKSDQLFDSGFGPFTTEEEIDSAVDEPQPDESPLRWEDAYRQDDDGDTHLHLAVIYGNEKVIETLILLAPKPDSLNLYNHLLQSPLHLAVLTNRPWVVRQLVIAGANPEIRNVSGNTPLHLACYRGRLECAQQLLRPITNTEIDRLRKKKLELQRKLNIPSSWGLDFRHWSSVSPVKHINAKNYDGENNVHLATLGGHRSLLRLLVDNGADIDAREGKSGRSCVHLAVELKDPLLVDYLVADCGADVAAATYSGLTPLQLARGYVLSMASDDDDSASCRSYSSHYRPVASGKAVTLSVEESMVDHLLQHGANPEDLIPHSDDSESDDEEDEDDLPAFAVNERRNLADDMKVNGELLW